MLHRFSVPELGVSGTAPAALRRCLAYFRKHRYELLSIEQLFRRLWDGMPLRRAVVFTLDDGYFDHAHVAAPVFSEFDCPATTFVTTDFADGKGWFWWDRLTFVFDETKRTELRARLGESVTDYRLDSPRARVTACADLNLRCQNATEEERLACVLALSREAEVELPSTPPPRFAPLSWDEARRLEKRGMTFGPHTVTHPVLSSTSDHQAEFEIAESWKRLSAQVSNPVPIFCYPSGRPRDFGPREIASIRALGLLGAVTGTPARLRPAEFRTSPVAPYRVPRFGYQDNFLDVLQCISGLEVLKSRLRSASS